MKNASNTTSKWVSTQPLRATDGTQWAVQSRINALGNPIQTHFAVCRWTQDRITDFGSELSLGGKILQIVWINNKEKCFIDPATLEKVIPRILGTDFSVTGIDSDEIDSRKEWGWRNVLYVQVDKQDILVYRDSLEAVNLGKLKTGEQILYLYHTWVGTCWVAIEGDNHVYINPNTLLRTPHKN